MENINGYVKVSVEEGLLDYIEDFLIRCDKAYEDSKEWKWEDFLLPFEKTPWYKFEWFRSTPEVDYKKIKENCLGFYFAYWYLGEDPLKHSIHNLVNRTDHYKKVKTLYLLLSEGSETYLNREALEQLEICRDCRERYEV